MTAKARSQGENRAVWFSWSTGFLTGEIRAAVQRIRTWPDVERVVTLPDIHLAGKACNGAVIATRGKIYPAAIGADIGCGMATVPLRTSVDIASDQRLRAAILQSWRRAIPILKSGAGAEEALPNPHSLSSSPLQSTALRDGFYQLGTLGRGNHFLELQVDEDQNYWLLVHSGSRAMGQVITAWHESTAATSRGLTSLDASTPQGRAYLQDIVWCRAYASANRKEILRRAVQLLGVLITIEIDFNELQETDHNHLEVRGELLIHRKGAQRVSPGDWGVLPGSMASATYHIEGRGCEESLDSCSHGAGRNLTRTQAAESLSHRDVRHSLAEVTCDDAQVTNLIDESPLVYRDIEAVLRAQRDLVKRTRKLTPLLTLKGGR